MKDFYGMRGNSTIMLGALNEGNKASVCVSNVCDTKKIADILKIGNITYENNHVTYKIKILFTILVFCLAMVVGGKAWGQQTLTVNDGTDNSEKVPFDGYNADHDQHDQMIYPAVDLTAMSGKIITQMVFYIDQSASNGSNTAVDRLGTWTVSLGETAETTLSGLDNTTTLTQVYQGNFDCSTGTLTLEFDEGYLYNGGNLLVDLNHVAASWNRWYFLGVAATGASYTYGSQRDFLPKTTFTYEDVPSCVKPASITASNITSSSADISWTEGGSATAWILKYGLAGFNVETEGTSENIYTDPEFQITGLSASTQYDVYVKAVCGENDRSGWRKASFRTACEAITSFPWSENFDGYTLASSYSVSSRTLPVCWNYINECSYNDYKYYPTVYYYSYTDYSHSTPNSLRMYSNYSSWTDYDPQPQYAILPAMENLNTKRIVLWARGYNASSTFKVGLMTDPSDASTFVQVGEEHALTTSYQKFTIDLTGTGNYIAIMIDAANSGRTNNGMYIDDITVMEQPSCFEPTGLSVSNVLARQATLNWTAGADETAWQYKINDGEWADIENASSGRTSYSCVISGLVAETTYSIQIRSNCGTDGYSDPTAAVLFTTTVACPVPQNITCTNITRSSALVSWANVSGISWKLQYKKTSASTWTEVVLVSSNSYSLVGLDDASTYEVQVMADCDGDGLSEWSSSVYFYTGHCQPTPTSVDGTGITNVTFGTGDVVVNNSERPTASPYYGDYSNLIGAVQAGVEATVSITYATGYTYGTIIWIDLNDNLVFDGNEVVYVGEAADANPTTLAATFTLPASTPTGDYRMRIAGADSYYNSYVGSISEAAEANSCPTSSFTIVHDYTIRVLDPPSCLNPLALRATNIAARTANLVWIPSGSETAWQICVNGDEEHLIDVTERPYTLTDLTPDTEYTIKIRANCGSEQSNWSSPINFTTLPSCYAPEDLAASEVTARSAKLSWTAGADETAWQICISDAPGHENIIDVTSNPYTLTDLMPSTRYIIKVRANCGDVDGVSAWSSNALFGTPVACPAPTDLSATLTPGNGTIATLGWTGNGTATDWVVEYGTAADFTGAVSETVTGTPSIDLTGLTAETTYYARVKAVCGGIDGESEWSDVISIEPTEKIVIGSGETTSNNLPTYNYYKYGLSQQIYTASEIGAIGYVNSVDFYNAGEEKTRTLDIYMVPTNKTSFDSSSDWISVSDDDIVYSGSVTFVANAWTTIVFDPHVYCDGTTNIALIVDDNTGEYTSSPHMACKTFSATSQAIYYYNDSNNQDPTAPTATGTIIDVKNQVRLFVVPGIPAACHRPKNLNVTSVGAREATIGWTAGDNEPNWNLSYKADDDPDWTEVANVTNPVTIDGLVPEKDYQVRVQANCEGGTGVSAWSKVASFTTLPACPAPTNISAEVTFTTATITWTEGLSETNWNLRYKANGAADWTIVNNVTYPYTITGLTADTHYELQLQSKCSAMSLSEWTASYSFFTGYCQPEPTTIDNNAITRVIFGTGDNVVNNTTRPLFPPYYGNYSNLIGAVPAGIESMVSITYETGVAYSTIIWIDLNNNLTFDGNEVVYVGKSSSANPTTLNATFTLPASTPTGDYRMRIAGAASYYNSFVSSIAAAEYANSCPTGTKTIVHDYTLRVLDVPSCLPPTAIAVESITATTANISWTENNSATNWEVEYSTNNDFSNSQTINATTNPFELTGLAPETEYILKVRADCSGGDFSVWSRTVSFTTLISCYPPTNLACTDLTASSATLSWEDNNSASEWKVEYSTNSDFSNSSILYASVTPEITISGLDSETIYYARVKAICGVDDESAWSSTVSFEPSAKVIIGSGTATDNYLPTYTLYNYTLSQQIYTAAEIGTSGYISSIDFYNGGTERTRTLDVYLVTTDKSSFTGAADWITVSDADKVFSGSVTFTAGVWKTITFDSNFYYDGTSNLAIIVDDNTGSYESGLACRVFNATSQAIRVYSDGTNYNPANPSGYSGNVMNVKNQIRLYIGELAACAKPTNLAVTTIGLRDAIVEWEAGGTESAWNLRYRVSGENSWTTITNVTSPYTIDGLQPSTGYEFQVQADCGGDYSDWTGSKTFSTKYGIVFFEEFANTTVPADWTRYTGRLDNVMNGTISLSTTTSGWIFGTNNGVFDNHARVNIFGQSCNYWLATPVIIMEPNVQLTFDLALTSYYGNGPADNSGLDDMFAVLISTDNGSTWTVLRKYDNVGSPDVYNNIATGGELITIDLSAYGSNEIIIAFYGESTDSNADNNLHIDNVLIDYIPSCFKPTGLAVISADLNTATIEWIPSGDETAWQYRLDNGAWTNLENVTGTTTKTATISGLTAATVYSLEVRAYCSDNLNDQSKPSEAVSFHTSLCSSNDMCEISYELTDSEGDGWDGSAIKVVDASTVEDGESQAEGTLAVCDERQIRFEWIDGGSSDECSYIVYDVNGEEILLGENAFAPTVYTVDCTVKTCKKPKNLIVSDITATSAQISWTPNGNFTTWEYSIDNGANWESVSGVTHADLTGLTEGQIYTVSVRTDCGSEQSEARVASFETGNMCEINYDLVDSYGDGWNNATIMVVDVTEGAIIATLTIPSGSNNVSGTLPVKDDHDIRLIWGDGSYDSECSYTITDASGAVIVSQTGSMTPSIINYTINCPTCIRPNNLITTEVTTTSAILSWEAGTASSWIIECSSSSDFSTIISSIAVNATPEKEYTGLTTDETYYFRVKAVCGIGDESSWSNVCEVTPSICRRMGNGLADNENLPSNSYYKYSYSQQIYTAAELGSAGLMSGISLYNNGTTVTRTFDLYIVPTNKTSFVNVSDWIPVSDADKVFSGSVTMTEGQWTQIDFDNAIEFDGARNIAVVIDDNTGSYVRGMSCLTYNATKQSLYVYSDGSNYNKDNMSSISGTLPTVKNQIKFCITGCEERPGTFEFANSSEIIPVGGTIDISGTNYLTNNVSPSGTIQWSSSDTRIATVSSEGVVTGHSAGKAIITASIPSVLENGTLYCAVQAEFAAVVDCGATDVLCFDFEDYAQPNTNYWIDAGIPSCWRRIYEGSHDGGAPHVYNGEFAMDGNAIEITSGNYQLYGQNYGYTNYVVMPYVSGLENGGMVKFNAWWQYVDYGTLTLGYMTDPDDASTFVAVENATPFLYNFGSATAGVNQISLPGNMPANAYIAFRWFCQTDYFSYSVAIDNICICSAAEGAFEFTTTVGTVLEGNTMSESIATYLRNEISIPGSVTYSSLNPIIAIVDGNGLVTGTSVGIATIEATFTPDDPAKCPSYAYFYVTVGSESCKEIGNSAATTYRAPVNNKYRYTYTQILYRQEEIDATGLITSISFQYAYNTPMTAKNSVKIYLKETDKTAFANQNDWVLGITEDDLVYSGALNCSQGWNSFFLDTPFPYSGGDNNLLLVIDDNSATSNSERYVFNSTTTSYNSVISYYSDNSNYGNNNISGHSKICDGARPNTKFCIYDGSKSTIVYNTSENCLNGVSGDIQSSVGVAGYPIFVTSDIPSCSTGLFLHWNTRPDDSGTSYASGAFIPQAPQDTLVLYAIYRLCDYVDIVKQGYVQQGVDDGGKDSFGIQKFNVCQGETIELVAEKKAGAPDNITFSWDVNRHDGNAHVTSNSSSVSYVATTTMGHDILLKVDGHDGCRQEIPLRVWVSHGLRVVDDQQTAGTICVGKAKEIIVGDPRVVPEAMIEVDNERLEIKSTQGQAVTKFIPDGVGECYTSDVTFADFKENAVIADASNIDYVKINLEHSHIGDVQISLKCYTPNHEPRTAILLQDCQGASGGGLDNDSYAWPYKVISCYAVFDRFVNDGYNSGDCIKGRASGSANMKVFVGYDNTSTGVRQEARAFDKDLTTAEMLTELRNMRNNNPGNIPADFCSGGYYYKFNRWVYNGNFSTGGAGNGGFGNTSYNQWYSEAASLGYGKPSMHDGLGNYILTNSYNEEGIGLDYCWSNSDSYQYAAADGNMLDNANHMRGYTNALIVKPSNASNGTQYYHPFQSFQSLVGCKLNGVWTIQICDSWGLDNGYIFNWEIGLKDIDDNAWSYEVKLEDSYVGNCGGYNSNNPYDDDNLISESSGSGTPNFYIHPTIANMESNGITLPTYPATLARNCELTLEDNIGCRTTGNGFTYNISQPAIPNIVSPDICLGEQAHVSADLGGPGMVSGNQSIFKWWTLPYGETEWQPLNDQGVVNPVSGVTSAEFSYIPTRSGDRFRAEIYDAHGCGGVIDDIIITNLPNIANMTDYDYIWHGKFVDATSTDWNTATNWYVNENGSYSVVTSTLPTTAHNVYIGESQCTKTTDVVLTDAASAKNLTIGSNASLTVTAGVPLSIAGDLVNEGALNANEGSGNNRSYVAFVGSGDQTISNAQTFGDVEFSQSGNDIHKIIANNGITVDHTASFNKGIVVGNATFNDGASANVSTFNSYVDGNVTKKGNTNSFTFPTGSDGVLGSFTTKIENNAPEGLSVRFNHKRGDGTDESGFSSEAPDYYPEWWTANSMCSDNDPQLDHVSNFEYWKVDGLGANTNLTSLSLVVDADSPTQHFHSGSQYDPSKICAVAHYDCWKNLGRVTSTVTGNHNTIRINGIPSIPRTRGGAFDGIVTLGSIDRSTLLPIELAAFSANCDGKSVLVEWTTASERNNDYFIIERSDDAINFVEIARVAGAGNSIEQLDYSYADYGKRSGDNYYRLVQVDYDGMRSISEIVVVFCADETGEEPEVLAYPNPFNDDLNIELDNFGDRPAQIDVFDMLGKLVYTESVENPQNSYNTVLQLGGLPTSTYNVRVSTSDFVINRKVVKN